MNEMIVADSLRKEFDEFVAVEEVSLAVGRGELLALLGPNGAGKTTTVRMLSAILRPTKGHAFINGHNVVDEAAAVRRSIGMLTEQPGLYLRMTGLEYLIFYGRLYGMSDSTIEKRGLALFDRFAMKGQASRRLGEYSKGMRQKVGLMRAMLHEPAVLLLDEPTSAMDPHSAKLVRDAIIEMRADKNAVILCTHNLAEAEFLADRIAIVRQGRIVADGSPAALKRQLVGLPRFELKVSKPLPAPPTTLSVALHQQDETTFHYTTTEPAEDNPQLIAELAANQIGVVTLREMTNSLEDVYLHVVGDSSPATPAAAGGG